MIMVTVSKWTLLFFVEPGLKVNSKYYRDVLLSQQMLILAIGYVAGDNYFVLHQDRAPAHQVRNKIQLLQMKHLISFLRSYGPQ